MEVSTPLEALFSVFTPWLSVLSDNPLLLVIQTALFIVAGLLGFLVFWTAKDILHRSNSFLVQLICIGLVACVPVIGFLLYVLVRPSVTIEQKAIQSDISRMKEMLEALSERGEAARSVLRHAASRSLEATSSSSSSVSSSSFDTEHNSSESAEPSPVTLPSTFSTSTVL